MTPSPQPEEVLIDESCPSCLGPNIPLPPGYHGRSKEFRKSEDLLIWISCSKCETWYHWPCVRSRSQGIPTALGEDKGDWKAQVELIDKWFCPSPSCSGSSSGNHPSLKPHPSRRTSTRPKPQIDYAASPPLSPESPDWIPLFAEFEAQGRILAGGFKTMPGEKLTLNWLLEEGCADGWAEQGRAGAWGEPIVVRETPGHPGGGIASMGGKMPRRTLTVEEVASLNGRDTRVEVVDVSSQASSKGPPGKVDGWTLGDWADWFTGPRQSEEKFNVISHEVSGTPLGEMVLPPKIVQDLDWVTRFWPASDIKHKPQVQLYCLMSPAKSFTDWHVDFAGSSVYYHVMSGSKIFYFIPPTKDNLGAYAKWSSSKNQAVSWLGDLVKDKVSKVVLGPGDTMLIPTGWIHAVHTPEDSLVLGGNFLHFYNISTQLRLRDIEIATEVPKKFRFPHFNKLCWYVAEHYRKELQTRQKIKTSRKPVIDNPATPTVHEPITPRLLDNLLCLATFLVQQVRPRERGSNVESAEPEFPFDRIKDPGAVVRELRWRVLMARGEQSEGEDEDYTVPMLRRRKGDGQTRKAEGVLADIGQNDPGLSKKRAHAPQSPRNVGETGTEVKKRKVEESPVVVPKEPTTWDADEFTEPVIKTRTVFLPRPNSLNAVNESALETYRSESQIRTRKQTELTGEISVEYSGTTRVVVKTVWPAPQPRNSLAHVQPRQPSVNPTPPLPVVGYHPAPPPHSYIQSGLVLARPPQAHNPIVSTNRPPPKLTHPPQQATYRLPSFPSGPVVPAQQQAYPRPTPPSLANAGSLDRHAQLGSRSQPTTFPTNETGASNLASADLHPPKPSSQILQTHPPAFSQVRPNPPMPPPQSHPSNPVYPPRAPFASHHVNLTSGRAPAAITSIPRPPVQFPAQPLPVNTLPAIQQPLRLPAPVTQDRSVIASKTVESVGSQAPVLPSIPAIPQAMPNTTPPPQPVRPPIPPTNAPPPTPTVPDVPPSAPAVSSGPLSTPAVPVVVPSPRAPVAVLPPPLAMKAPSPPRTTPSEVPTPIVRPPPPTPETAPKVTNDFAPVPAPAPPTALKVSATVTTGRAPATPSTTAGSRRTTRSSSGKKDEVTALPPPPAATKEDSEDSLSELSSEDEL